MTRSLADRTQAALRDRFERWGHNPSPEHWKGLCAIAEIIETQANGSARKEFTYSALPTGMGKTSVLVEAVRILVSDPAFTDVGVVIFTNTLDQIPVLIGEMGLQPEQFAVRTGAANEELNQKGRGSWRTITRGPRKGELVWESDDKEAQVLFTTQQKLLNVARFRHDFETVWLYRGKPRRVRVWDEAILPADPLTFTVPEIRHFAEDLILNGAKHVGETWREWTLGLPAEARTVGYSTAPEVLFRLSFNDLDRLEQSVLAEGSAGEELASLGGRRVRVRPADASGSATAITYQNVLPDNFAPLLILDASGALRLTYEAWRLGRGGLRALPSPGKMYRNLTIYHWDHAAGKVTYRNPARQGELADAVLQALLQVPPDEKLLVIHRLHRDPHPNFVRRVRTKVRAAGENPDRLQFIHWGKHTASNEHSDIRHVIVVGLHQYSLASNEALFRAAGGFPPNRKVSSEKLYKFRLGESAHHLLQAVGRSAVRRAVDGDVPKGCILWIVFSTIGHMEVPRAFMEEIFPGASIRDWEPHGPQVRTSKLKSDARAKFLEALIAKLGSRDDISFEVYDLVPRSDSAGRQRAQRYLNDGEVMRVLAAQGVVLEKRQEKRQRDGSWARVSVYTLRRSARGGLINISKEELGQDVKQTGLPGTTEEPGDVAPASETVD